MDFLPSLLLGTWVLYSLACGVFGTESGAPLWLRWPLPIWNLIAHDWRTPKPAPRRPDYAKIARLERELGIGGATRPGLSPFEQGMRRVMTEDGRDS